MTIGEPFGSLCICALTTAGRRPSGAVIESPPRAVSRAETLTPGLLAASALELIPRQPTRDRSDAAPRRRTRSPGRPEARTLTSTENTELSPTHPATAPTELEHAETGAPDVDQIAQ